MCFERQAADACSLCDMEQAQIAGVIESVRKRLETFSRSQSPVEMAVDINEIVNAAAGVNDPYAAIKDASNRACREAMDDLSEYMTDAADTFETALKLSIAGNLIDFGAYKPVTLSEGHILKTVQETMELPLTGNSPLELKALIDEAKSILFVGDNAGECFLDTFLLDQMPCEKVTYAVRGKPVLNDANRADAELAGIPKYCRLIDTGDDTPGVNLERCSEEFMEVFNKADLIIAKGQGNYESLSDGHDTPCVFLTKVKCPVIARDIGHPVGSSVIQIINKNSNN